MGQLLFKCPGSACEITGFDIKIFTPERFSTAKGGAKSKVLTSSLPTVWGSEQRPETEKS